MGRSRISFWFAAISIGALMAGFLIGPTLGAQTQPGITGYYTGGPNAKLPNGGRPAAHVPFPEIRDWSSLRIRLVRGMCMGSCPVYSIEIRGDGTVTYNGVSSVAVTGTRTAHIPQAQVRALFDQFRKADFFWTLDHYRADVTDLPQFTTSISFDGHSKIVTDYAGDWIGMPKPVGDLELAIDRTAGSAKWVQRHIE